MAGLQVVATVPGSGDATFRDNVGVLVEKTSRDDLTVKEYLDASVANAGKVARGILEPSVEYQLFTLNKGDVASEPLDTPRGFWVVRRVE